MYLLGPPRIELKGEELHIGHTKAVTLLTYLAIEAGPHRRNALRRANGESWVSAGEVVFHAEGPLQIGLCAIGNIDRAVCPGAYPDAKAVRFESFTL